LGYLCIRRNASWENTIALIRKKIALTKLHRSVPLAGLFAGGLSPAKCPAKSPAKKFTLFRCYKRYLNHIMARQKSPKQAGSFLAKKDAQPGFNFPTKMHRQVFPHKRCTIGILLPN